MGQPESRHRAGAAAVHRPEADARLVQDRRPAALAGAVHAQPAAGDPGRRLDHRARRSVDGAGRVCRRHADLGNRIKHQVEEDIKPFRDVLLGLFFITVGMLLNVRLVFEHWALVLVLLAGPVLLKFVLIAGLAKLFGSSDGIAIRTGLALAQAGEFGFVLLNLAGGIQLMDPFVIQVVLASMVLSMLMAPFLIAKSDQIVMKVSSNEWMMQSLALTKIASRTMSTNKHVIVAGFGRSGQSLATLLTEEKIDYHALDLDPERVQEARTAGAHVSYGDAARRESLIAAGIYRASAIVITYASTPSALKVLHLVHELAPTLPVIVRSYDDT